MHSPGVLSHSYTLTCSAAFVLGAALITATFTGCGGGHRSAIETFAEGVDGPIVIDATRFGAIADGRTDSTAAFQSAIDEVASRGGGTVIIPPGKRPYLISDALRITTDNVVLEGPGATILMADDALNGEVIDCIEIRGTEDNPVEHVRVEGLTIDANYWNQPGAYNPRGIDVDDARNIVIDEVTITRAFVGLTFGKNTHYCDARDVTITAWHNDAFNASGDGVSGSCSNIRFIRCTAEDAYNGAHGGLPGARNNAWEIEDGAQNITLIDCVVRRCGGDGFAVRNHGGPGPVLTSDVRFERCIAEDVGQYGFKAVGNPAPNTVSGIHLIDCVSDAEAAFHKDIRDLRISGSTFSSEVVVGPVDRSVIRDSSIERLRVWAFDNDGHTEYETDVRLEGVELGSPISIHGDTSRVRTSPMSTAEH
ncbi:MAG: glycosyl hydrolase family 28-related protein [Planctomycetota bacterium]